MLKELKINDKEHVVERIKQYIESNNLRGDVFIGNNNFLCINIPEIISIHETFGFQFNIERLFVTPCNDFTDLVYNINRIINITTDILNLLTIE